MAAEICGTPTALVSLADPERQAFKARAGLTQMRLTPGLMDFVDHVLAAREVFAVADAGVDPRFESNPAVSGDLPVRFFAGAPARSSSGARKRPVWLSATAAMSSGVP